MSAGKHPSTSILHSAKTLKGQTLSISRGAERMRSNKSRHRPLFMTEIEIYAQNLNFSELVFVVIIVVFVDLKTI